MISWARKMMKSLWKTLHQYRLSYKVRYIMHSTKKDVTLNVSRRYVLSEHLSCISQICSFSFKSCTIVNCLKQLRIVWEVKNECARLFLSQASWTISKFLLTLLRSSFLHRIRFRIEPLPWIWILDLVKAWSIICYGHRQGDGVIIRLPVHLSILIYYNFCK